MNRCPCVVMAIKSTSFSRAMSNLRTQRHAFARGPSVGLTAAAARDHAVAAVNAALGVGRGHSVQLPSDLSQVPAVARSTSHGLCGAPALPVAGLRSLR